MSLSSSRCRLHAHRGGDEVLVREHAALRRAGRAGRVDERREVVLVATGVGLGCVAVRASASNAASSSKRRISRRPAARKHGLELLALLVVLGEGEHRLGVAEDVRALARGVRRVEADDDGADRHDRPVEQDPLEARPREDGDRVAAADAAGEERRAERVDPLRRPPATRPRASRPLLLEVGGRRAALLEHVAPEGGRRAGLERESARRRRRDAVVTIAS